MSSILPVLEPRPLTSHPVDVGQRTEAIVLARLVALGHDVLVPWGHNHRYDLVVDLGDRMLRVQCKTGRLKDGVIEFNTLSVRTNTERWLVRSYDGEADVFAVSCPETKGVYLVPVEGAPRSSCRLRLEPTENHQAAGIRWARDYELPEP